MGGSHVITILVLLSLFAWALYLQRPQPGGACERRATGTKRKRSQTSPAKAAPTSLATSLLQTVKWETISNMLRWKAEMSDLDTILEGVEGIKTASSGGGPPADAAGLH